MFFADEAEKIDSAVLYSEGSPVTGAGAIQMQGRKPTALKGEETSTNPIATIFAWSGAFRKRGEKDNLPELVAYADKLEAACLDTLNEGYATKDLVNLMEGITPKMLTSAQFLAEIRKHLETALEA